ncbi:MAG: TolC family protein, partial [Bacteroidales bacterium]
ESEYKLAQMQQEVVHASIAQAEADFRETILITADEFNLQRQFVEGSEEADTIAKVAYDITRRRYLSGQADIIKLSTYQRSSISARRAYIESLESYWRYYYTIRKLTLHDFETGKDLNQEFEEVFGR